MSELDTENDADVSSEDTPAPWDMTLIALSDGDVIATVVATVSRRIRLITCETG